MKEMGGVLGKALAIELAMVPEEDKQRDSTAQGVDGAGETAGFARQAGEVVAQLCIQALYPVGFALVRHGRMASRGIDQTRWLPAFVRPILFCLLVAWQSGHVLVYPVYLDSFI
ncbi:MAG TPA: hypothetical protein VER79_08275 [Candidatus Limnocylindrales bacterium]|nr:hypothetical protein [Candidatus Limnocylindrales bacterium]